MFFKKEKKEVMVSVSPFACNGCGKCVRKCHHGAMQLRYDENNSPYAWHAYLSKCTGCGKCQKVCKQNAIDIIEFSAIVQPIPVRNK